VVNSLIRRFILQHAHPAKFVAEILGVISCTYLLWIHNWIGAVITSLILFLGSTIALWNKPVEYLAETRRGKIMLVYATASNFIIYNLSALPVVYGLWTHQGLYVVAGYSLLFLPHLWAWKRKSHTHKSV
jgi:hypothetical protein